MFENMAGFVDASPHHMRHRRAIIRGKIPTTMPIAHPALPLATPVISSHGLLWMRHDFLPR